MVTEIKSNVIRYKDAKAILNYETLSEVIRYFIRNYLNDPNFLHLVFKPIYDLPNLYTTKDAVKNINTVENILSTVKTAKMTIQALEEMHAVQVYLEASLRYLHRGMDKTHS